MDDINQYQRPSDSPKWTLFAKKLKAALREDIPRLFALIGDEAIYGIALVTDTFLETLYIAMNSEEAHQRQLKEKAIQLKTPLPLTTQYALRAEAENWAYNSSSLQYPAILPLNQLLINKEIEDFNQFELEFYEIVIEVLQTLDQEGLFFREEAQPRRQLFVTIEGDKRRAAIEAYSISQLN